MEKPFIKKTLLLGTLLVKDLVPFGDHRIISGSPSLKKSRLMVTTKIKIHLGHHFNHQKT